MKIIALVFALIATIINILDNSINAQGAAIGCLAGAVIILACVESKNKND